MVEEQFNKYEQICYDGIQYKNFDFIDSKNSTLIQLSDCINALVGKYQTFINNLNPTTIGDTLCYLNTQKKNLKLFAQIIKNPKILMFYYFIQQIVQNLVKLGTLYSTKLYYSILRMTSTNYA